MITKRELAKLKSPMDLKFRVKALLPDNKNPTEMIIVPFVNSRQVQIRLDEVLGSENWMDEYYEVKGKQFCRIGIRVNGEWIYKSDSGSVSFEDPSKGETSDAFKRAAVKWGINRDAYQLGEVTMKCKLQLGAPVPCDEKGRMLTGNEILEECIRLSSQKNQDLVFDRNVLPAKQIASIPTKPAVKTKRTPKPKTIMP